MVSIRFSRVGRPGIARYRLNAIDSHKSTQSPPLETLAAYNPSAKDGEKLTNVKKERLEHWLKVGAQLSESAKRILRKENFIPSPVKIESASPQKQPS